MSLEKVDHLTGKAKGRGDVGPSHRYAVAIMSAIITL